jgi:hypothetical protein
VNDNSQGVLHGIIPKDLPLAATAILQELKAVREPLPCTLPFNDMITGFKNWKEGTTTSPSGKHLGIYKSLIEAKQHRIMTVQEKGINDRTITTIADKALSIQHLIMNLAIQETCVLTRWQTVHNFMLEKIPGTPLIDKLRVIHIYEADWNMILRYFIAHKLKQKTMQEKTGTTAQVGGRPGCSSIDVATKTVLTYETSRLQRTNAAVIYNDAKACYDRIVENIGNMALMREGLNPKVAKIHAATMQKIKYYVKHKLGIGSKPNQHMHPKPVLGNGQGAADSGDKWGTISDALIRAYSKVAKDANLQGPISYIIIIMTK